MCILMITTHLAPKCFNRGAAHQSYIGLPKARKKSTRSKYFTRVIESIYWKCSTSMSLHSHLHPHLMNIKQPSIPNLWDFINVLDYCNSFLACRAANLFHCDGHESASDLGTTYNFNAPSNSGTLGVSFINA